MKLIVVFTFVALVVADVEFYKVDDIPDVDSALSNRMKLQEYLDCFSDKTPCSTLAASYKTNIREAIEQGCNRCDPNLKYLFWRFLQATKELLPQEYRKLKHYYDPENKYFNTLEREISKYIKPGTDVHV